MASPPEKRPRRRRRRTSIVTGETPTLDITPRTLVLQSTAAAIARETAPQRTSPAEMTRLAGVREQARVVAIAFRNYAVGGAEREYRRFLTSYRRHCGDADFMRMFSRELRETVTSNPFIGQLIGAYTRARGGAIYMDDFARTLHQTRARYVAETASPENVRLLAAVLGRRRRLSSTEFPEHLLRSARAILGSRTGARAQQDAARRALEEHARSSIRLSHVGTPNLMRQLRRVEPMEGDTTFSVDRTDLERFISGLRSSGYDIDIGRLGERRVEVMRDGVSVGSLRTESVLGTPRYEFRSHDPGLTNELQRISAAEVTSSLPRARQTR